MQSDPENENNFFKTLSQSVLRWVEDQVPEAFHGFCDEYPRLGYGIAMLVAIGWGGSQLDLPSLISRDDQFAGVSSGLPADKPANPLSLPYGTGGAEYFVFTDYWTPKDKEAYEVEGDAIVLKDGHKNVLFTYKQDVPELQDFNFSFVAEGLDGVNLSFGRAEFYEVVIGDNDDKTISLKVRQKIDGDWVYVPEYNWEIAHPNNNPLRPFVSNCYLNSGEEIVVTLEEKYLSEIKKMKIGITVSCKNRESDYLVFQFEPVPNWNKREKVYFGLVDYSSSEFARSKIYFLNPDLPKFLDTE